MITISHDRASGTVVHGTDKGDGSAAVLKLSGFRWSRNLGAWYVPSSRDRAAKTWIIRGAVDKLRVAGFEVTYEIDDTTPGRPVAEVEQDRYDRATDRASYHNDRAEVCEGEAVWRWNAELAILNWIPAGQPILVGHHSEKRHRRALAKADAHMAAAREAERKAGYHDNRASAAERYQAGRVAIPTTLRRIQKLEADERRIVWGISGDTTPATGGLLARLETDLAGVREQIAYWRAHVQAVEQSGVKVWSAADFSKGDFVSFAGTWYEVLRVNPKSVTIPALPSPGPVVTKATSPYTWTDTLPYHKVRGQRGAAQVTETV